MISAADRGPLWEIFLEELQEYADALGRDVLALERGDSDSSRDELLGSLFRIAHSLKTGASALGVEVVSASCHALEGILAAALRGDGVADDELVRLLLAASDAMADSVSKLHQGDHVAWTQMLTLLPELTDAIPAPEAMPSELVEEYQQTRSESVSSLGSDPDGQTPLPVPPRERGSYRISARHQGKGRQRRSVRVSSSRIDSLLARGRAAVGASERLQERAMEMQAIVDAMQMAPSSTANEEAGKSKSERQLLRLRARLESVAESVAKDQAALADVTALHAALVRLRMVPFERVFGRLERAVRELATASDRQVELLIEGGEVEVERATLERLVDPLFHLVRNAIGHGLETPAVRQAVGKEAWGTVTVRAIQLSGAVAIEVEDDGAGVDLSALRRAAAEHGVPDDDENDVARLVFEAGLSTVDQVTPISGRGIGLDVVRARVRELGGKVDISTRPGEGTTFRLHLPETLPEQAPAAELEDSD